MEVQTLVRLVVSPLNSNRLICLMLRPHLEEVRMEQKLVKVRARGLEYSTGTVGASSTNVESVYKLFLFDVKMFVELTLSGTPSPTLLSVHSNESTQVKGVTSGATGFIFASAKWDNCSSNFSCRDFSRRREDNHI